MVKPHHPNTNIFHLDYVLRSTSNPRHLRLDDWGSAAIWADLYSAREAIETWPEKYGGYEPIQIYLLPDDVRNTHGLERRPYVQI